MINKLDLIGSDPRKMEVIAITDKVQKKSTSSKEGGKESGKNQNSIGTLQTAHPVAVQPELQFQVGELERALYAKVVKKCGNPNHWEEWAADIAKIAKTHISRITQIVGDAKNTKEVAAFQAFANELRDDLNDSITDAEVIEMLAQHLITKPVFDALFVDYSFASHNPVSQAMQQVLGVLHEHRLEKEADTLEKFYASVKLRAASIDDVSAKQKIVVELYDKFFRNAFPKMTERLGIVYTPIEVVDFIIHSVNDLLQQEFGQTLGSKGVHIIDPFTGTGTFITRLLQSGLISKEQLPHKYKHEIHANEIVLLAYYIAAINIEAVYHSLVGGKYDPFEGICLTDTFRLGEEDLVSGLLANNSDRRKRQQKLEVRVIMGNPPYSAGQKEDNDDAANVKYTSLDESLRNSYVAASTGNPRSLYDAYIRAFRWASDRIGKCGIIGFVTNAGWVDGRAADGLRKCLANEFSSIHVFHLRGNARTSGEQRRKEKDNVFGQGSRAPVAISLLVKNPNSNEQGKIKFHDIGDYLSVDRKLEMINNFGSVRGIADANAWTEIYPDAQGDWINQRNVGFLQFMIMGDKKGGGQAIFESYSSGVKTNRDSWAYNSSKAAVTSNMERMADFYNHLIAIPEPDRRDINDAKRISWSWVLRERFNKGRKADFSPERITSAVYRPFSKMHLYYDRMFNENRYLMPSIFTGDPNHSNLAITLGIGGSGSGSPPLIVNQIFSLQPNHGTQCFPLYLYEKAEDLPNPVSGDLFSNSAILTTLTYTRRDAVSNVGLTHFQAAYPGKSEGSTITKEDLFYYIYGLLHSLDYRNRYADNLGKELP